MTLFIYIVFWYFMLTILEIILNYFAKKDTFEYQIAYVLKNADGMK
jgi:hypothetical protein